MNAYINKGLVLLKRLLKTKYLLKLNITFYKPKNSNNEKTIRIHETGKERTV